MQDKKISWSDPQHPQHLVEMRGIVKRFYGKAVNDCVDLTLRCGEVLALLGENGAGKSTLVKILYGLYTPDAGRILIKGQPVCIGSPRRAISLGIGMVHQHFTLVPDLTAAENIALSVRDMRRGIFLDLEGEEERIRGLSSRYGIAVDPSKKVRDLSVGERQRVEILKLLSRGSEILVLDEPTAVLTPGEAEELYRVIAALKREEAGIILITHKLHEVMAASDRVTVLRGGKVVFEGETGRTDARALTAAMIGGLAPAPARRAARPTGGVVLEVRGLRAMGGHGAETLKGVSFTVGRGEIFGIVGVSGNGQRELAEVLSGVRRASAGWFSVNGARMTGEKPRALALRGVGRIPEDRMESGAVLDLPLKHNLVLERYHLPPFARGLSLDDGAVEAHAERLIAEYGIRAHSAGIETGSLSGGNIQKAILARAIDPRPSLIVASQPVRGLDVGAAALIHEKLLGERDRGAAVLLISEDLDEILSVSDNVGVIFGGRLLGIFPRAEAERERIGALMAGVTGEAR